MSSKMFFSGGSMTSRVTRSALLMGCGALVYYFYRKYRTQENSVEFNSSSGNTSISYVLASNFITPEITMDVTIESSASDTEPLDLSSTATVSPDVDVTSAGRSISVSHALPFNFIIPEITMDVTIEGLETEFSASDTEASEMSSSASESSSDALPLQEEFETPDVDHVGTNDDLSSLPSFSDVDKINSEDVDFLIPPHFWDDIQECHESFNYGGNFYQSTPQTSRSPSESDTIVLYLHSLNEDETLEVDI